MMDERIGGAIAGAIVVALVFGDIMGCTSREDRQKEEKLVQAERGLAYACGYIHGQRAVIEAAKIKIAPPSVPKECPVYTEEAIENGFRVARKNR